jgi:hypothetical protein
MNTAGSDFRLVKLKPTISWRNTEKQSVIACSKNAKISASNVRNMAQHSLLILAKYKEECLFWDVILCGSCKNRSFSGIYCLNHQGDKNRRVCYIAFLRSVLRLLVTANTPSLPILVTLMTEAICWSKTSVLTRAMWCNIPEDGIFHSHRCDNLKSCKV